MPFASAAELKSTPVPMRLIAKVPCHGRPPEKGPVIWMMEVRSDTIWHFLTVVERRRWSGSTDQAALATPCR